MVVIGNDAYITDNINSGFVYNLFFEMLKELPSHSTSLVNRNIIFFYTNSSSLVLSYHTNSNALRETSLKQSMHLSVEHPNFILWLPLSSTWTFCVGYKLNRCTWEWEWLIWRLVSYLPLKKLELPSGGLWTKWPWGLPVSCTPRGCMLHPEVTTEATTM